MRPNSSATRTALSYWIQTTIRVKLYQTTSAFYVLLPPKSSSRFRRSSVRARRSPRGWASGAGCSPPRTATCSSISMGFALELVAEPADGVSTPGARATTPSRRSCTPTSCALGLRAGRSCTASSLTSSRRRAARLAAPAARGHRIVPDALLERPACGSRRGARGRPAPHLARLHKAVHFGPTRYWQTCVCLRRAGGVWTIGPQVRLSGQRRARGATVPIQGDWRRRISKHRGHRDPRYR